MARRIDHQRYTISSKLRMNIALLLGGLGMILVAKVLCATQAGAMFGAPLWVAGPVLIGFALLSMVVSLFQRHVDVACPTCGAVHQVEWGVNSFLCTTCGARVGSIPSGYGRKK